MRRTRRVGKDAEGHKRDVVERERERKRESEKKVEREKMNG